MNLKLKQFKQLVKVKSIQFLDFISFCSEYSEISCSLIFYFSNSLIFFFLSIRNYKNFSWLILLSCSKLSNLSVPFAYFRFSVFNSSFSILLFLSFSLDFLYLFISTTENDDYLFSAILFLFFPVFIVISDFFLLC